MWIVYALVVHLLLLGSIFVIYFRSPVIKGLQPQAPLNAEPPANRLVLIVTDGLRAESFFDDNCSNVPHLRQIFMKQGAVGISRTRVPTESRPGHIALIAGLYEDPSAVTRGWKENPIEFDTVFNRSDQTYAWGAHDVLHIFEKLAGSGRPMYFDAYDHLDFSGKDKTYKQDKWVFERVRLLLNRKKEELRDAKKVVFFLHLLGLDTAGHVHKPGKPLFLENLKYTEEEIYKIYEYFEEIFPDKRTAYLLTADHGMTDSGSHGAGSAYETDTPFMLWGAGVAHSPNSNTVFLAYDEEFPLRELEQAQLTPLMSALIGLPPPMNNFGVLPLGYMNAGEKYEMLAAYTNALQLIAQYTMLQEQHNRGIFAPYLKSFTELTILQIDDYKAKMKAELELENYRIMQEYSVIIMRYALEGIDYYHGYYCNVLLICTTMTFLGWILYLYRLLDQDKSIAKKATTAAGEASRITLIFCVAAVLLVIFVIVQRVPISVGFYLLLPLIIWLLALQPVKERRCETTVYSPSTVAQQASASPIQILLLIACAELLVFTFFERRLISLCFVAFAVYSNWGSFKLKTWKFYKWLLLVITLTGFPLMPASVGYQNNYMLLAGIVVLLLREFMNKEKRNYRWHTKFFNALILINTTMCIYLHSNQLAVPLPLKLLSWLYLVYAIVSIEFSKETSLELRLAQIQYNFGALYVLFCTSYEALFMQLLAMELTASLEAQRSLAEPLHHQPQSLQASLRLAFTILLYTFFSLFGSGNSATISSFDPNIARCFLSQFAPFVIMSLVLLKLLLPVILNLAIVYTHSDYMRQQERQIFICLLIICDIMGLNFLFLVRNTGSWLEIGSSISHFVIIEVTTLVLLILAYAAKLLLRLANCNQVVSKLQ